MNNFWIDKYAKYIVISCSIIFFVVGLYRLDFLSYWIDEAFYYARAYNYINNGDSLFVGYDNNGVLIAPILAAFFKLFGASDFIGRLVNLIIGTLCIPTLYYLGKTLVNKNVGVYAAALMAFSLYTLFLSRLCRYFTILEFTQLLLLINFYLAFEANSVSKKAHIFFIRNKISPLYLGLLPFTFFIAILGGQLNSFFVFSLALYYLLMYLVNFEKIKFNFFKHKYGVLFFPALFFFLVLTIPFFQQHILKPIFGLLNNENNYQNFMPNRESLFATFKSVDELFNVFKVYIGVPLNDYRVLPYFGFLGVVFAFFINKKLGIFLISFMIFPILLISFVYRDFVHPRFMVFLYPMVLITFAIFLNRLGLFLDQLIKKRFKREHRPTIPIFILLLILLAAPIKETYNMLNVEMHGNVIKRDLFYGRFSNWKKAAEIVKKNIGKDDIVLATDILLCKHYLNIDNEIYHFRQMRYNGAIKEYEKYEEDLKEPNVNSARALIKLVIRSKVKIWLIGDFYLYNVMTDPLARKFVERNFKYYFNIVKEGDITLWSYDPNHKIQNQAYVIDLGKPLSFFKDLTTLKIKFNEEQLKSKSVTVIMDQEGIDFSREAVISINGDKKYFFPSPKTSGRSEIKLPIDVRILKQVNDIKVGYYPSIKRPAELKKDRNKGFVIYDLRFRFSNL